MERSLEYELRATGSFLLKLIIACLLLSLAAYIANGYMDSSFVLGNVRSRWDGRPLLSIVQQNLLVVAVSIIVTSFLYVSSELKTQLHMGISRGTVFKTGLIASIVMALGISFYFALALKLEPLFMERILVKGEYGYLHQLGNLDTLKDSSFKIFFSNFIVWLAIIAHWKLVALFINAFKFYSIPIFMAWGVIDYPPVTDIFRRVLAVFEGFTISAITDGLDSPRAIMIAFLGIALRFGLIYIFIKRLKVEGE